MAKTAESACFTALATAARKAGDDWSCSKDLSVKTGEELEIFVGAMPRSGGIKDSMDFLEIRQERHGIKAAAWLLRVLLVFISRRLTFK